MRNLIAFLVKNSYWFLFIFLEITCFFFIFQHNLYQKSFFFNSSNEVVGRVYAISGNVTSFFGLRKHNQELLFENAHLQQKIHDLEVYIQETTQDTIINHTFWGDSIGKDPYEYIAANVIHNSISRVENYIYINKGSKEGIREGMGAVCEKGIIGFVRVVSPNYSFIQSLLNPKTQLSCKIKRSNSPGTLVWNAKDYRYADLINFPRYERFQVGDTIVTSGISRFFPEGLFVGTVEEGIPQRDDNFLSLKIKLAADFASLNTILVIDNYTKIELENLKKEIGYE